MSADEASGAAGRDGAGDRPRADSGEKRAGENTTAEKKAGGTPWGAQVRPEDIYRWGPKWSRHVGRFLARVYWNTRIIGSEKVPRTGPVIVASNHTGIIDGPLLHGCLPRGSHFIVKQEFFDSKIGFLMRWAGQIPVDRSNGRAALQVGEAFLNEGRVVGIFPEGSRGSGAVNQARAGVAWLAARTGAPVVPVACLGTRPRGTRRGYVPRPRSRLTVVFGDPIVPPISDESLSNRDKLRIAMDVIRTGLAEHVASAVQQTGIPLPEDEPSLDAGD